MIWGGIYITLCTCFSLDPHSRRYILQYVDIIDGRNMTSSSSSSSTGIGTRGGSGTSGTSSGGNWKDLLKAASVGDMAGAKYHLRKDCTGNGVDPNYQHPEYFTAPIFEAIRGGHLDMVRLLVQGENSDDNDDKDDDQKLSTRSKTTTRDTTRANPQLVEELTDMTPTEVALEEGQHGIVDYLNTRLPDEAQWHPRKVLVTGGNRGIGKAIVEQLLKQGHSVAFTCRDAIVGEMVVKELIKSTGNTKLLLIVGELTSIASTRAMVKTILDQQFVPTTLIHNAGLWPTECRINPDLLEQSFMVNYMAPYLLTQMLLPTMIEEATMTKSSSPVLRDIRVILVTAGLAVFGLADVHKTPFGRDFSRFKTYQNTKQCGLIWCMHQARLQKERQQQQQQPPSVEQPNNKTNNDNHNNQVSVVFNAVHPGVINTGLGEGDDMNQCLRCILKIVKKWWKTPTEGAGAPVWLAVNPSAKHSQGTLYWEMNPYDLPMKHPSAAITVMDPVSQDQWAQWTEDFLSRRDHEAGRKY
jgi:NAD(P)-dependent dehydrogenase (short-subunit alcohol dehydrogenase family)